MNIELPKKVISKLYPLIYMIVILKVKIKSLLSREQHPTIQFATAREKDWIIQKDGKDQEMIQSSTTNLINLIISYLSY